MRKTWAALACAALSGCVVGPDYSAPALELPGAWPADDVALQASPGNEVALGAWWQRFGDPALDGLVERALSGNLELRLQAVRVEEARARLGLARAEQLPTVGLQAEASRQRQPGAAIGIEGIEVPPYDLFSVAGVLGYEVDLWGRLAREREVAAAQLERNAYALEAVRLGVIADVAVGYFGLRSAQRQLEIAERSVADRIESARLERLRFEAGQVDELVYRQAESELAAARAELPSRIEALRQRESALGLLLGLSPRELLATLQVDGPAEDAATLPPGVPLYLPSELLARRPDLRAAEAELMAATAGIGVAEAARLPRLNLAALAGVASTRIGDLFEGDSELWSVSAGLAGPVFDFGRSRARVETAEALREQAELRYRAAVAIAFAEVRDALLFYQTSGDRLAAIEVQVEIARRTGALAQIRYREGYIGILELLDAQRVLLQADLALAQVRANRFAAAATLYKALGGGW